jgi:hypothetical protein
MYRYRAGYTFDRRRLHCRQIPLDITPEEIREVNIRIFNQMGGTEERQNRIEKYKLADPGGRWQSSYAHLTQRPACQDPLPIGGCFRLAEIREDGIQGNLSTRTVEAGEIPAEVVAPHLKYLHATTRDLLPLLRQFHDYKIDAFVVRAGPNGLVAEYAYDASRDVSLTVEEAWLLEDLRQHRDLFLCVARLAVRFGIGIRDVPGYYRERFDALVRKSILRRPVD